MSAVRKTLSYLGLVDEEETYVEESHVQYITPAKKAASRFQSRPKPATHENQIVTVHPEKYADAKTIAENYRLDIPVIVNVKKMETEEAKRLIDFCSGLVLGLEGKIERVTSKVFLLSPHNIFVTSEGTPSDTQEFNYLQP